MKKKKKRDEEVIFDFVSLSVVLIIDEKCYKGYNIIIIMLYTPLLHCVSL